MGLTLKFPRIAGSEYLPKFEIFSSLEPGKGEGMGIWDICGEYNPKLGLITIYENEILNWAKKLHVQDKETEIIYLILRELVRLHEHSHAYLHTARILKGKVKEGQYFLEERDWFFKLPKDVNESLTEFLAFSIIKSSPFNSLILEVFEEADKTTPPYYRKWKTADKLRPSTSFIPPIAKFARTKIWQDWEEFYREFVKKESEIVEEACLLALEGEEI